MISVRMILGVGRLKVIVVFVMVVLNSSVIDSRV